MDKRCSFQRKTPKSFLVVMLKKHSSSKMHYLWVIGKTHPIFITVHMCSRTYMPYVYRVSEVDKREPSLLRNNAQNGQNEENVCHTKSRSAVAYDGLTNLVLTSVKKWALPWINGLSYRDRGTSWYGWQQQWFWRCVHSESGFLKMCQCPVSRFGWESFLNFATNAHSI